MLTADPKRPNGGPKFLYKYRALHGREGELGRTLEVVEGTIWAAHRSTFNDPFDCAPVVVRQPDAKIRKESVERMVDRQTTNLNRQQRRAKIRELDKLLFGPSGSDHIQSSTNKTYDHTGVFSLSENPDDLLMWGHYGSDHTGIAVQFEFEITKVAADILAPVAVIYGQARPTLGYPTTDDRWVITACFLSKAEFWAYEKEQRILFSNGVGKKQISSCQGRVTGVIFGVFTSEENKTFIRKHASSLPGMPIKFYQAQLSGSQYKIEVHEL